MARKIIITKDLKKKADIIIGDAGTITFIKENIVIKDASGDCKAKRIFLAKLKAGNPKAKIIEE